VGYLVCASVVALWLVRDGLTAAYPAGGDIPAHVVRTDFAFHQVFANGRLDGWFPGFGSGYRLFAVNGPGLAIVLGVVRILSFDTIDTPRAVAITGALSIAAMPWCVFSLGRALGATRRAAVLQGVGSLFVSFYAGGGPSGLYGTGLIAQSIALPLLVLALATMLRIAQPSPVPVSSPVPSSPTLRSAGALAGGAALVAALALLHPISILVLATLAPPIAVVLAASGAVAGSPEARSRRLGNRWRSHSMGARARARRAAVALGRLLVLGLWGAALAGFWVIPALRARSLRGSVTAWGVPPFPSRMMDVWRGETLLPRSVAVAIVFGWAITLVRVAMRRSSWVSLAPSAVGMAYLATTHLLLGHHHGPLEIMVQLPVRALPIVAIFALGPLADATAALIGVLPGPHRVVRPLTMVLVMACVPRLVVGILDPRQVAVPPTPALRDAADALHTLVPPMARHLFVVPEPGVSLGTDNPIRWIAEASGTNSAHLYLWEATNENSAGILANDFLTHRTAAGALQDLRRFGVTAVVVSSADQADELASVEGFDAIWHEDPITIFAVRPAPGAPEPGQLLQPAGDAGSVSVEALERSSDRLRWRVGASAEGPGPVAVIAAVAFDPAWRATIDGRSVPVARSEEGLVRFDVPAGAHEIELRFTGAGIDGGGFALSLLSAGIALLLLARRRLRGRVTPSRPPFIVRRWLDGSGSGSVGVG
jgi:hypothetical protein